MISLSPNDVENRFARMGIPNRFKEEEKQELATTLIVDQGNEIMAFPTPRDNAGLNLLRLKQLRGSDPGNQPMLFDHPWYSEEVFARQDCAPGWHYVGMGVLPESISQPLNYADSLKARGFDLATAVEVTLMLFLHYAGTKEQLLQKKHTWCSDQASLGRCVTVGAFGRNGLFVSGHPPEFASRGLGICGRVI